MVNKKVGLINAHVKHARLTPKNNKFSYRVFYLKVPIVKEDLQNKQDEYNDWPPKSKALYGMNNSFTISEPAEQVHGGDTKNPDGDQNGNE